MRIWGRALLVEGTPRVQRPWDGVPLSQEGKGDKWAKGCENEEGGQEGACGLHEEFGFGQELGGKVGVGLESWGLSGQNEGGLRHTRERGLHGRTSHGSLARSLKRPASAPWALRSERPELECSSLPLPTLWLGGSPLD